MLRVSALIYLSVTFLFLLFLKEGLANIPDTSQTKILRSNPVSAEKSEILSKFVQKFNKIKSLKATIIQTDPQGRTVFGTFWLQRPSKMRLEYDNPLQPLIVSDGNYLRVIDQELENTTYFDLDETPAKIFLTPQIELSQYIVLKEVELENKTKVITIKDKAENNDYQVSLYISEKNDLLRWDIKDAQDKITIIQLDNSKTNISIDPNKFTKFPHYKRK